MELAISRGSGAKLAGSSGIGSLFLRIMIT